MLILGSLHHLSEVSRRSDVGSPKKPAARGTPERSLHLQRGTPALLLGGRESPIEGQRPSPEGAWMMRRVSSETIYRERPSSSNRETGELALEPDGVALF